MKITFVLLIVLLSYSSALAWDNDYEVKPTWDNDYEVKPKYWDSNPKDGFMDPGSSINPYIIRDRHGRETHEIKPKYLVVS